MNIDNLKTTNKLLLILAIPLVFYVLMILSFIFIPLVLAIFLALLFMPMMRAFSRKKVPKAVSLILVLLIIATTIFASIKVIQLSGKEFARDQSELYERMDQKVGDHVKPLARTMGIDTETHDSTIKSILLDNKINSMLYENFGATFGVVRKTVSLILLTIFFLVLLLAGSLNFKDILQETMFRHNTRAIKTFMTIERSIAKFLKVKFFMSLCTGIGFFLVCYFFEISFPLFWGLLAFAINFVQMVGSVISTVLAALFTLLELSSPGAALAAILCFTAVQVVFGSILEPIFMGKSFSINIVTVLVMLMFWGFLWGVPGLILSIPITVLIKTILEQFPNTRVMSRLMT